MALYSLENKDARARYGILKESGAGGPRTYTRGRSCVKERENALLENGTEGPSGLVPFNRRPKPTTVGVARGAE